MMEWMEEDNIKPLPSVVYSKYENRRPWRVCPREEEEEAGLDRLSESSRICLLRTSVASLFMT